MISIVICSKYKDITQELKGNIARTIGVEYELVVIDNSSQKYSIFTAYNIGVSLSKGSIICFMHDDVYFYSKDWGKRVTATLVGEVGACAVAGSNYIRKSPSFYPIGGKFNLINLIQKTHKKNVVWKDYSLSLDLAVFDGLWFCIKRKLFDQIRFDEEMYSGYHFYDSDIAMQIQCANYRIKTIPEVWIMHLSGGNINQSWLKNAHTFYKKWNFVLPISYITIDNREARILECKALYSLLKMDIKMRQWHLLLQWSLIVKNVLGITGLYDIFHHHKKHN